MTRHATITHDGRDVLMNVPVDLELDGPRWAGVLETRDDWPVETRGLFRLHLSDGRSGAFTPTRQCGRDLGTTVVMFQGAEPLDATPRA